MNSRQLLIAAALAALSVIGSGCRYYSSKPDESGLTDSELQKMMEAPAPGSAEPGVLELTADETIEVLLDPELGKSATDVLKVSKRRVSGKVLETSPEGSETPFVIVDAGTHRDQACKVKCFLAADQRDTLQDVKAGDDVRVTGRSDGVISSGTLEFKNCVFNTGATSPAPAPKP
jgi:hypothetical protein